MLSHRATLPELPLQNFPALRPPGLALQIAVRLRRSSLDRALSDGVDPLDSSLLATRAVQLNRPATRARIARGLERLALSAERPHSRARIEPSRTAMRSNRTDLLDLAEMLRHDRPLYAPGIAALMTMLTDGTGPVYTDRRGEAVARQLELARAVLGGRFR